MRPSRKRAIQSARKGEKNMENKALMPGTMIFDKTVEFIQETVDMLAAVGEAEDKRIGLENHQTDLGVAALIVKAAIKEGQRPAGCPADYDLAKFTALVDLENSLRDHAKL